MSRSLRLLAGCLLLGSCLLGQARPTRNEVLGLTWSSSQTDPSLLWQKMDHAGCAQRSCAIVGFERGSGSFAFAGGTAYNGDVPPNLSQSLGGVWVSNGSKIALVDPKTCGYRCQPQAAPLKHSQSQVTGLAYVEETATLFMSDSQNLLYWVETQGCVLPSPVICESFQKTVLKAPYVIGGLATDDLRRRLFVSASDFGPGGGANKIFVFSFGSPSKPIPKSWCVSSRICELAVPTCGSVQLGPITGLGFDASTDTLYYTDGRNTHASRLAYDPAGGTCSLTLLGCCSRSTGDPFSGLCVMQKQAISSGKACVMAPCIDCPSMRAGTYGDAFLGNRNFALTLSGAPTAASPVFIGLGAGPCVAPGVQIGFCETARLWLGTTPMVLPVLLPPAGSGPCDGKAVISLGVPPVTSFAGIPISAQWAMDCAGPGGRGGAISNCITFEITTN